MAQIRIRITSGVNKHVHDRSIVLISTGLLGEILSNDLSCERLLAASKSRVNVTTSACYQGTDSGLLLIRLVICVYRVTTDRRLM